MKVNDCLQLFRGFSIFSNDRETRMNENDSFEFLSKTKGCSFDKWIKEPQVNWHCSRRNIVTIHRQNEKSVVSNDRSARGNFCRISTTLSNPFRLFDEGILMISSRINNHQIQWKHLWSIDVIFINELLPVPTISSSWNSFVDWLGLDVLDQFMDQHRSSLLSFPS